jgi:CRP-like cAMP-binding protein
MPGRAEQPPIPKTATVVQSARGNLLLDAIPRMELAAVVNDMHLVPLRERQVLYDQGVAQPVVFFPISGIVAFDYVMLDGNTTEVGQAGKDGLVSLAAVYGTTPAANRAVVVIEGQAWSLPSRTLRARLLTSNGLRKVLDKYTLAFLAQVSQTAVCNRLHSTDQRLARWLLHTVDRLPAAIIAMTQGEIANMLGVRREAVSYAATKLLASGAITYFRGTLRVLDRTLVEATSCECYKVVAREAARI